jgi:hypothetical protein
MARMKESFSDAGAEMEQAMIDLVDIECFGSADSERSIDEIIESLSQTQKTWEHLECPHLVKIAGVMISRLQEMKIEGGE